MNNEATGQGVRMGRGSTALRLIGLLALCASAADAIWLAGAEKNAHYLFGYWFDAAWTVQLPLLLIGVVAIAASFFLQRDRQEARK